MSAGNPDQKVYVYAAFSSLINGNLPRQTNFWAGGCSTGGAPKERRRHRAEKRLSKRVFLESPFLLCPLKVFKIFQAFLTTNLKGAEKKWTLQKYPFGQPFLRTSPSPLLWRALWSTFGEGSPCRTLSLSFSLKFLQFCCAESWGFRAEVFAEVFSLNAPAKQARKLREKLRRKLCEKLRPELPPSKTETSPKTSLCRNLLLNLRLIFLFFPFPGFWPLSVPCRPSRVPIRSRSNNIPSDFASRALPNRNESPNRKHSASLDLNWKATKEYLNQRGTKIRVFRVRFRAPFLPPFFHRFSPLFPLQALFTLPPLLPSSPPPLSPPSWLPKNSDFGTPLI